MDPPFRVFTFKMLGKLILELGMSENEKTVLKREDFQFFNEVLLKKKKKKIFFGKKTNIFKKAQKQSIYRMNSLFKNAIIAEFMVENFENEWKIMK